MQPPRAAINNLLKYRIMKTITTEIKRFEYLLNSSEVNNTITISYYLEDSEPYFNLSIYDPFLKFNNLDQSHRYLDDYLTGFIYSDIRDMYEDKYNIIDELKNKIKDSLYNQLLNQ